MTADPLDELRERVAAAQAAAERLADDVGDVPRAVGEAGAEIHALAALAHAVRALLPEDLWEGLCDLVRGLLMLVRAVLDRWIEALGQPPPSAPAPRDVPIA
jgi:hypothetical protein